MFQLLLVYNLIALLVYLHPFCCSALKYSKLLEDMASKGIKYIDCYGVDNALVKLSSFLFCIIN